MRLNTDVYVKSLISGDVAGFVKVCEDSEWKIFADCNWTSAESQVVCRELGNSTAGRPFIISIYAWPTCVALPSRLARFHLQQILQYPCNKSTARCCRTFVGAVDLKASSHNV